MVMKRSLSIFWGLVITLLLCLPVRAEVKVIEADSSYVVGDNDTNVGARRIATQQAQRKALELAGTYVESLTEVKNYQLTKDDIKTYTAGILETKVVADELRGTAARRESYIKVQCKIDTAVLLSQIDRYRESEDLKEQLDASAKDNEALRKERDALVTQLKAEKDKAKAAATRQKLDTVLAKEEANDETNKVWINIGSQLVQVDENGRQIKQADLDNSSVILQKALKANPQNPRARTMLASIYQRKGNAFQAEQELRTAIQRNPSNPLLHLRLGILLHNQAKYQDALRELHVVERTRPHNPDMLFYTGMTFKQLGKCPRSVQYLNRFLKDPRANNFPRKKEIAVQTVETCGGDRPGRARKFRER